MIELPHSEASRAWAEARARLGEKYTDAALQVIDRALILLAADPAEQRRRRATALRLLVSAVAIDIPPGRGRQAVIIRKCLAEIDRAQRSVRSTDLTALAREASGARGEHAPCETKLKSIIRAVLASDRAKNPAEIAR